MKHLSILFIVLGMSVLYSCQNEPSEKPKVELTVVNDFSATQLLFTAIEHDLYLGELALAADHTNRLKNKISDNKQMYCLDESTDVNHLINDLEVYENKVLDENIHWSLDRLRDLKGQYVMLQTRDDYDPFLYQLWRFEEDMYDVTKAAMDPKLDLYEWGEFKMMVDCMNDEWQLVNLHYPSMELFGNNHLGYKIQTTAKIHLQKSMEKFNIALMSGDYEKYDLCDHAISLRENYVRYINTFISQEEELTPFLATL